MSAEKIINAEVEKIITLKVPEMKEKLFTSRVDINHLLARARKEEKKDNFTNLLFFGLFVALVAVSGIILSF